MCLRAFRDRARKALLDHFGEINDLREAWRVAHQLPEMLLLVVCGTICDCLCVVGERRGPAPQPRSGAPKAQGHKAPDSQFERNDAKIRA